MRMAIIDNNNVVLNYTEDEAYQPAEGERLINFEQAVTYQSRWVNKYVGDPAGLKAYIADMRWKKEMLGITVGSQRVTTERDEAAHWLSRKIDAEKWLSNDAETLATNPTGVYPYKPKDSTEVAILSAAMSIRCYKCSAWYINMCFATEYQLNQMIDGGVPLDAVYDSLDTVWPQTQFDGV